jgi:ABC-type proline/glycine betaine transport system permease subunit
MVISVNKNNPNYYVLSALFTTILAILVYQLTKRVSRATIAQPGQAVYAVTR